MQFFCRFCTLKNEFNLGIDIHRFVLQYNGKNEALKTRKKERFKIATDNTRKAKIREFLFLNLGILLMAVGIYFFKAPNGFATGGVSGISVILANIFPMFGQAFYMLIINLLLPVSARASEII